MDPLPAESLSDLHLEACATAMRGYCRLEGITQAHLAGLIGVTPVHLSYVLHGQRQPGPRFERGIADSTRLPPELKDALLANLWAAQRCREAEQAELSYRARHQPLHELLAAIEDDYALVGNGRIEPERVRAIHLRLHRTCAQLSAHLPYARQDPSAYVRLCIIRAEIGCVLDRLYDALQAALLAERVAGALDAPDRRSRVLELYTPQVNALRVKGVVHYNLRLYRQAYEACLRLEENPIVQESPGLWLPHIVRDKLKALAHTGRFSVRDAEAWARPGLDACAGPGWEPAIGEMLSLLVHLSLVHCYLSHGGQADLVKARRILGGYLDLARERREGALTPMHRVMYFRAVAEVEEALAGQGREESDASASALRAALEVAGRAGLQNQLHKITARRRVPR